MPVRGVYESSVTSVYPLCPLWNVFRLLAKSSCGAKFGETL